MGLVRAGWGWLHGIDTPPLKEKKFSSIGLDLARGRISPLNEAKDSLKALSYDENQQEVYAFADINCNLCIRVGDGDFKFFKNKHELDQIIGFLDQ